MKKFLLFVGTILACVYVFKDTMSNMSSSNSNDSASSSRSSKVKKGGLKIYDVDVTSEKVERDEDSNDCYIFIKGDTDAPDGSIVYAQRGNGEGNMAYGNDEDATDNKVKSHHIKFLLLASNLFDLDSIRVGQSADLKIYCTNQNFKYSLDDSELISKKVRKKVAESDIEPYTVTATKKMVHIAEYD
uniref:hypothetical protein n=1 Tax=Lactobacillus acidophilus TaxID=1579 RepID=UPI003F5740EF